MGKDSCVSPFEPDLLRLGKEFGTRFVGDYVQGQEDVSFEVERGAPRAAGTARWKGSTRVDATLDAPLRRGRIDLLLTGTDSATGLPFEVVFEVKNTDWDRIAAHRVQPNIGRHRRQIWGYLEPLTDQLEEGVLAWLQAGVVYPHRPADRDRAEFIEQAFGEYAISVLWYEDLG